MSKLKYKIVNKRPLSVDRVPGMNSSGPCSPGAVMEPSLDMVQVDIEWTHEDGFPIATHEVPVNYKHAELVVNLLLQEMEKLKIITNKQKENTLSMLPGLLGVNNPSQQGEAAILKVNNPEQRVVIKDQLNVPPNTGIETLVMILEAKKDKLAKSLGVEV